MSDAPRKIKATDEEHAKLDWAYSIINEFMMKHNLAVLKSRNLDLVVTYIAEGEIE